MRRSAAPSQRSFNPLIGTAVPIKSNAELLALLASRHQLKEEVEDQVPTAAGSEEVSSRSVPIW